VTGTARLFRASSVAVPEDVSTCVAAANCASSVPPVPVGIRTVPLRNVWSPCARAAMLTPVVPVTAEFSGIERVRHKSARTDATGRQVIAGLDSGECGGSGGALGATAPAPGLADAAAARSDGKDTSGGMTTAATTGPDHGLPPVLRRSTDKPVVPPRCTGAR